MTPSRSKKRTDQAPPAKAGEGLRSRPAMPMPILPAQATLQIDQQVTVDLVTGVARFKLRLITLAGYGADPLQSKIAEGQATLATGTWELLVADISTAVRGMIPGGGSDAG